MHIEFQKHGKHKINLLPTFITSAGQVFCNSYYNALSQEERSEDIYLKVLTSSHVGDKENKNFEYNCSINFKPSFKHNDVNNKSFFSQQES